MPRMTPLLAAAAFAALSVPAFALTSDQPAPAQERAEAEAPAFLSNRGEGQWFVSDYIGSQVYDVNGEEIGEVDELMIDRSGRIIAVVIGTGGFLAIGERDIAIPMSAVELVVGNGNPHVVARYTRRELERAPSFTKDPGLAGKSR